MDYGFSEITRDLYLGGEIASPHDVVLLKAAGVTRVINCREICDPAYAESVLPTCWPFPRQPDDNVARTVGWFHEGGDFWWANRGACIYTHCHAGMERSHAMVIFLLMLLGLRFSDALALAVRHRPLTVLGVRYLDEAQAAAISWRAPQPAPGSSCVI